MKRNMAVLLLVLLLLCGRPLRAKAESESTAAEETSRITGIAVTQTTADGVYVEVGFTTSRYAEIVVALYDGAENRVMVANGAEMVDEGQETCEIFAAWKGEAFSSFKVVAYLLERDNWVLLCPSAFILQGDVAQTKSDAGTGSAATPGALAGIVEAPYENAYILAYTLAKYTTWSTYKGNPFSNANLVYITQLSGEELKTFAVELPKGAELLVVRCDFTDAPLLLQEEEEIDPEEGGDAPSEVDETPEEKTEEGSEGDNTGDGDAAAQGSASASVDSAGNSTSTASVSQSISSGSEASGTQALWIVAAGAGIFAAAAVAKKIFFAQGQDGEQMIRMDLQIGRWILQVSNHAAAQPAQKGQPESASAAEEEAAANE